MKKYLAPRIEVICLQIEMSLAVGSAAIFVLPADSEQMQDYWEEENINGDLEW